MNYLSNSGLLLTLSLLGPPLAIMVIVAYKGALNRRPGRRY
jgi:hypothetical protein